MLQSLQGCRAIAAILVVLVHTNATLSLSKYLGVQPFGPIFEFGFIGVDFFFVLSGFIIMHVHARDIGKPRELGAYLWKRFGRAYPPYWVVLASLLPVFLLVPQFGVGYERDPDVILRAIFLFPHPEHHTVLVVAWTMVYEILFYLLFAVLVINKRAGIVVFLCWTAGVIAFPWFESYPWNFVFSSWHFRILAGVGAAMLLSRWRVPAPRTFALIGVVLVLFTAVYHAHVEPLSPMVLTLGCTLGSVLTIVGFGEAERSGLLRVPGSLVYLGNATYAIYLVHFPALSILAKLTKIAGLDTYLPGTVLFVLHVAGAIGVGCAFHHLIENPLHRWSKRFFRRKAAVVADISSGQPLRKAA